MYKSNPTLFEWNSSPIVYKTTKEWGKISPVIKYLDEDLKPDVLKLLDLKINTPEITEGKRFDKVNDYIDKNIAKIEEIIKESPDEHMQSWEDLNKIFIELL